MSRLAFGQSELIMDDSRGRAVRLGSLVNLPRTVILTAVLFTLAPAFSLEASPIQDNAALALPGTSQATS
jgi:hypothetical protein